MIFVRKDNIQERHEKENLVFLMETEVDSK